MGKIVINLIKYINQLIELMDLIGSGQIHAVNIDARTP